MHTHSSKKTDFDTPKQRCSGQSPLDPPFSRLILLLSTCRYKYNRSFKTLVMLLSLVSIRYFRQNCCYGIIVLTDIAITHVIAYLEWHFKKFLLAKYKNLN